MKNIIGIIPARYGSTRLEGKPLVIICGKTMIQRVYEQAKKAIKNVVVATDNKRIYDAVINFGGKVVMTSRAHTTGTNRCLEAFEIIQKTTTKKFDIVLNIQGDEPLLEPEQIKQLISCFDDQRTEMATLIMPTTKKEELKSGVFVVKDKNNFALYFSRAVIPFIRDQSKENWCKNNTYFKHVGMYGFLPKALKKFSKMEYTNLENCEKLEQLRWLENGYKIKVTTTLHNSVSVDTLEDVKKVIKIISERKLN
ncbi:MAG: 3-deoxy-manno-octulosonate cytidylyltransferase [Flavobacteriaceae bacterium]|nr:3-deoxy-manno-octulosonate cytidylyltransferase [Flavobacteriaceae bacterium]